MRQHYSSRFTSRAGICRASKLIAMLAMTSLLLACGAIGQVTPSTPQPQVKLASPTPRSIPPTRTPEPAQPQPTAEKIVPAADWNTTPGLLVFTLHDGTVIPLEIDACDGLDIGRVNIADFKPDVPYKLPFFEWTITYDTGEGFDSKSTFYLDIRSKAGADTELSWGSMDEATVERGPNLTGRLTFTEGGRTIRAIWQCP